MDYPLSRLASVLSGKGDFKIFPNQTTMFRVLVTFSSNTLNSTYGISTTDNLIPYIQKYLKDIYANQTEDMNDLHSCIYQNLLDPAGDVPHFNKNYGFNRRYLSPSNSTVNAGNINKTISGTRSMPTAWIHMFCTNKDNPEPAIHRIFWLLQYFCVYYCQHEPDIQKTPSLLPELSTNSIQYIAYFQLSEVYKNALISGLKKKCNSLSPLINELSIDNFDLHILSRIIWDILVKHYLQTQADKLSYAVPQFPTESSIIPNREQYDIYQSQVAVFGAKTIDRFHQLVKYAPKNIYAAHELSNIYFYGETFVYEGGTNFYQVLPDYKKSAEYCTLAINNSNPPYSPACWFLGYLIYTGFFSDYEKDPTKLAVAKYYFEKAGHYAPAYNSLAQIYIKEAESIYESTKSLSEQLVLRFATAIELANKAADMGWFYGNNVIAFFIERHCKDTALLSAIDQATHLSTPFDYEKQLLVSSKNNNPWAIHSLAVYYISLEKRELAIPLLNQVIKLNYNKAYYTLATITDDPKEAYNCFMRSSALGYPHATFQIALKELEKGNIDKYYELLSTAKQQNLVLPEIDLELQRELNERLN